MKEEIRRKLLHSGAVAVGFAKAGETSHEIQKEYESWIGEGCHGEMSYLERHVPLRQHTDNVLPGTATVISLAFSYAPEEWRSENLPYIAAYAYGEDYHTALRKILYPIVEDFKKKYGGSWRICIDSAPLAERYWAMKSGIGKRGLNGAVIVEGCGALGFLVEILTTIDITPDSPSAASCDKCGRCVKSCPTKALRGDGTMDARRCINYLTIEKKGEFSNEEKEILAQGKGYLYGCDICLRICPHNEHKMHAGTACFYINEEIKNLIPENLLSIDSRTFKQKFNNSPILYAGFPRLLRNALALKNKSAGNL